MILLTEDYMQGAYARSVPGAFYDERKWWLDPVGVTPRTAAIVLKLFPELGITNPELSELRDTAAQDVRPTDFATKWVEEHGGRAVAARTCEASGFTLHDYQAVDVGYAKAMIEGNGGFYLGWALGLGKTLATCALIDEWDSNFNLIVCPNTIKASVWGDELERCVPWIETVVLRNSAKHREADIEAVLTRLDADEPVNFVVHYEALPLIAGKTKQLQVSAGKWREVDIHYKAEEHEKTRIVIGTGWEQFGSWDLVVCDEAHRLRNNKTQMVKALKKVKSVGRLALSGSIIENALEEMYSPLNWLYPQKYRAKWRDWNDKYIDYIDGPFGKVSVGPRESALPQLREELGRVIAYRTADDELDIPQPHEREVLVELSPRQRRHYDELVTSLATRLDDGTELLVEEGLSLLAKLRQVASGLDLVGDVADSTKLEVAQDLIEDTDGQVVVFGWYRASLEALADRLGRDNCFIIHGDVSHKARTAASARFQAGERKVMLASIAAAGEGLNWQNAAGVITIDRDWNPQKTKQAVGRVVRQGQQRHVAITHLMAKDTVDCERVMPVIRSKESLRRVVLGA